MSNTGKFRQNLNSKITSNNKKEISAIKVREVLTDAADAIDEIFETFSLADRLGVYNAATGIYTISETGITGTIVALPQFEKGKYFDVVVAGTNSIPVVSTQWTVGDKIISSVTKWDRIPHSDLALTKAINLETIIKTADNGDLIVQDGLLNIGLILQADGTFKVSQVVSSDFKFMESGELLSDHITDLKSLKLTLSLSNDGYLRVQDSNGNVGLELDPTGDLRIKSIDVLSSANMPLSFKPNYVFPLTDIVFAPSYGQSNSNGGGEARVITSLQKYDSLVPVGGTFVGTGGDMSSFIPFIETTTESPLGGAFEKINEIIESKNYIDYDKKEFQLIGTLPGQGGVAIAGLSKGTTPYNRLVAQIHQLSTTALINKKTFSMPFMFFTQGETDIVDGTTYASYKTAFEQLIADIQADTKDLLPKNNKLFFIGYQVSYTTAALKDLNVISKAHLDEGLSNPYYVCSGPVYHMDYTTEGALNIHLTPESRRIYGAYLARAADQTLRGGKFLPLHPINLFVEGNTLIVTYHVPIGALVLDTTLVPNPGNYGFKVLNSVGGVLSLSNIRTEDNRLLIDCSASPLGGKFMCARDTGADLYDNGNGSKKLADRSCLRDCAGDYDRFDNYPLHNWAAISYLTI